MPRFFPLAVSKVHHDTRDAVILTLIPRTEDAAIFKFIQGQYLTFRRNFDGHELRRSYSICAAVADDQLRIGIKRVDGGTFSTWAKQEIAVGDTLEAMPPAGNFYKPLKRSASKSYLAFAGGSGITPVLSLIKTTLDTEANSSFTLVYANRSISAIMFREELEDLKNLYMSRFSVVHILENEAQDIDLFAGRLDQQKCQQLFASWINLSDIDTTFICGPEPMMLTIAQALRDHGLSDSQIKFELFGSSQPGRAPRQQTTQTDTRQQAPCIATITLDGQSRSISFMDHTESVLNAALRAQLDAPYSCEAGVCASCRAKVLDGEVEMVKNHALEDYEVQQGYVLTCQCYPLSDTVHISYDE